MTTTMKRATLSSSKTTSNNAADDPDRRPPPPRPNIYRDLWPAILSSLGVGVVVYYSLEVCLQWTIPLLIEVSLADLGDVAAVEESPRLQVASARLRPRGRQTQG